VRTAELHDPARDRRLPTETWYPAADRHAGADLDDATKDEFDVVPGVSTRKQQAVRDAEPADGTFVPVVFSHGFGGHRRQTTHLCSHLASHGYVVTAPDHVGNTLDDVMRDLLGGVSDERALEVFAESAADRPADVSLALDALGAGDAGLPVVDGAAGVAGHSFGGWTALAAVAADDRFAAALPLAPGGGDVGNIDGIDVRDTLELDWGRVVPTLFMAADGDSILGLDGIRDLFVRTPSATGLVVLHDADHFHFQDDVESMHDLMSTIMGGTLRPSSELMSGAEAYQLIDGVGLAHFDAHLRGLDEAADLLDDDLQAMLAGRGIDVEVVRPAG
jgi:predicted dienelactone hydrolase